MAFTAAADGYKLPILIIIPRKFPLKHFECPKNVVIVYKQKSKTFDSAIMNNHFVPKVILPYMYRRGLDKINLHLDNSPVHKRSDLLNKFSYHNIEPSFFPARMTSLLQPADVGWFRSLKTQYQNKWQNWFITSEKAFTKQHNLKSPGYARVINWISQIWTDFDPSIIKNSFKITGITSGDVNTYNHLLKDVLNGKPLPSYIIADNDSEEMNIFQASESDSSSLASIEGSQRSITELDCSNYSRSSCSNDDRYYDSSTGDDELDNRNMDDGDDYIDDVNDDSNSELNDSLTDEADDDDDNVNDDIADEGWMNDEEISENFISDFDDGNDESLIFLH